MGRTRGRITTDKCLWVALIYFVVGSILSRFEVRQIDLLKRLIVVQDMELCKVYYEM